MNRCITVVSALLVLAPPQVARAADAGPEATSVAAVEDRPPADEPETHPRRVAFGVAPLAAVRFVDNLSIDEGGMGLILGGVGPVSANLNVEAAFGKTPDGLMFFGMSATCTAERRHESGLRFGAGAGISLFALFRATTGEAILSMGPVALARIGYDFGFPRGVYTTLDLEGELQGRIVAEVAVIWGPTLQVGYRF